MVNLINALKFSKAKRAVLYTAAYGDFKKIKKQPIPNRIEYIAISNENLIEYSNSNPVYFPNLFEIPKRSAQVVKIFSTAFTHTYDYNIWIDNTVEINDPKFLIDLLTLLDEFEIVTIMHPDRDCIYDEMNACHEGKRDQYETMKDQISKYRKLGYPEKHGLSATGIIARRYCSNVRKLEELWWKEIHNHSMRDQLSFNYILWELERQGTPVSHLALDINLWNNQYFKIVYGNESLDLTKERPAINQT